MGVGSEARVIREILDLRRSALWPESAAPDGRSHTVVLLNGFGTPAATLRPLARWLRSGGWTVEVGPVGWNVDCGERTVEGLLDLLGHCRDRDRAPAAVVGHSRGGLLGRVAAVRAPDRVASLTTVCTPWMVGLPERRGVAATARAVRFARRRGLDVLGSIDCGDGACCATFRRDMAETPAVRWTAIWSSRDQIGGPASVAPDGPDEMVDIRTTHVGAVFSVPAWTAIASALTGTA